MSVYVPIPVDPERRAGLRLVRKLVRGWGGVGPPMGARPIMSLSPIVKAICHEHRLSTHPRIPAVRTTSAFEAGSWTTGVASSGAFTAEMVYQVGLKREKKTAAITRVRWLERDRFDGGPMCRQLSGGGAETVIAELNQLRSALGWLEIDVDGRWRWPHGQAHSP